MPSMNSTQAARLGSLPFRLYEGAVGGAVGAGRQGDGTAAERCRCLAASLKYLPHLQEMPRATASNPHPATLTPELPAMLSVNPTKLKPTPIKHWAQTPRQ